MPPPRLPSKADVEAAVDRAIARSDSAAGIVSGPTGEPILTIAMLLADAATNPGAPFTPEAILLLAHLMRDDRARYEMARDKLKKHGIRVGELDKIVKAHAGAGDEISAGAALVWDEEAPWFAPVDGAALLDSLRDALGKFLVLPEHGAATMALWTLSAYGFDCFSIRLPPKPPEPPPGQSGVRPGAVTRSLRRAVRWSRRPGRSRPTLPQQPARSPANRAPPGRRPPAEAATPSPSSPSEGS